MRRMNSAKQKKQKKHKHTEQEQEQEQEQEKKEQQEDEHYRKRDEHETKRDATKVYVRLPLSMPLIKKCAEYTCWVYFGHRRGPCPAPMSGPIWLARDLEGACNYAGKGGWVDCIQVKSLRLLKITPENVHELMLEALDDENPYLTLHQALAHKYVVTEKWIAFRELNGQLHPSLQLVLPKSTLPGERFDRYKKHFNALRSKGKLTHTERVRFEAIDNNVGEYNVTHALQHAFLNRGLSKKLCRNSITARDRVIADWMMRIQDCNGYIADKIESFHAEVMILPCAFKHLHWVATESSATLFPYTTSVANTLLLEKRLDALMCARSTA